MQLSFSVLAFLTTVAIPVLTNAQNEFNTPTGLWCSGEKAEMTCYIEPPTSEPFFAIFVPQISFNGSQPYSQSEIDSNSIQGIDTSRYKIQYLGAESPRTACTIVISSYLPKDGNTVFGCHGEYYNGTYTTALASGDGPQPVDPPNKVKNLFSYINSIGSYCVASIDISFDHPTSNSPITNYNLYVDGEMEQKLGIQTNYPIVYLSVAPGKTYQLSVTADNCGGTSEMSDQYSISIPSFNLGNTVSLSLDYFNNLVIQWSLSDNVISLNLIPITYRLKIDSSFAYEQTSSILNQTVTFQQYSDETMYSFNLGLSVIGEKEVTLDTIVKLTITSQCGKEFAGTTVTGRETGLKSTVQLINIPYNISWIIVAVLIIVSVVCTGSNVVLVLYTMNEYSKKRSSHRRQAYLNLVSREASQPLLNPPSYAVNTDGVNNNK